MAHGVHGAAGDTAQKHVVLEQDQEVEHAQILYHKMEEVIAPEQIWKLKLVR